METDRRYMTRSEVAVAQYDVGLRQYMLSVYNYMASALALTGLVAYATATYAMANPAVAQLLFVSPLKWVVMLAPVVLVFFLAARVHAMSSGTAQVTFWIYATLMGLSLASIFLVFTGQSIARVFFITAGTFAGVSLYGYTTKRDLTAMGSFLMMGLFGIVIASLVNMFIGSNALQFAITVLSVLIFTGLTAYDTQKIKEMYLDSDVDDVMAKKALMGALTLYLDFINIFIALVQLFGEKRE
jgi:FtsH-binding integral membrane protein